GGGRAVARGPSRAGSALGLQRSTQTTRARKPGIHAGPTPRAARHKARARLLAGTTTLTSWPAAVSRSAYVRIARTPPAMRRCGHKNVIFTPRSDGHRAPAALAVRLGIEHDVHAPDLVGRERAPECRADLARIRDIGAAPAQRLDHEVVARDRQRGRHRARLAEKRHLRAAD